MVKMGRPKSDSPMDKKLSVRFTQQEYEILLEYTKTHQMTLSQAIKKCVEMQILNERK